MRAVAIMRGVTSFCIGSVPSARMASICSVTFIEPSSLAMPDELRPATMTAGQHRSQFAHQDDRDHSARAARLAVLLQRAAHLQGHHGAGEEAGQQNDRHAAHADDVHLQQNVVDIVGFTEDIPERPAGQIEELLNRLHGALQKVKHSAPSVDVTLWKSTLR